MKKRPICPNRTLYRLMILLFPFLMLVACSTYAANQTQGQPKETKVSPPANERHNKPDGFVKPHSPPLPLTAKGLNPGLAVLYFPDKSVRHIDSLPKGDSALSSGRPGPPITNLNRRFGRREVFKSGTNRLVGLEMSGYILLEKKGPYIFQVYSNDGFRIHLDGGLLIEDPEWHPKSYQNRLKTSEAFEVGQPAWYSLRIRYFQRKGTAAFQLFWQPPGKADFQPVPSTALAHLQSY